MSSSASTRRVMIQWQWFAGLAAISTTLLILFLLQQWQPETQVQKKFDAFISAVEHRKWDKVEKMISPDFHDPWEIGQERLLREAREVFRHFFSLELQTDEFPEISAKEDQMEISSQITIRGNGTAIAEMVKGEVNSRKARLILTYQKQSWKPWDWKIQSIFSNEINPAHYRHH